MLLNENKYTKKRTDMREMNVVFFTFQIYIDNYNC